MAVAADSVRQLTRAYIGARVSQGLIFWFALLHNVNDVLSKVGDPSPRVRVWLFWGALVSAGTLGSYYQRRFGRVEPAKPSLLRQVRRATIFVLVLMLIPMVISMTMLVIARSSPSSFNEFETFMAGSSLRPMDLMWLLLSGGTALSLANSRGERLGWVVPLVASVVLLATLVVPALQPYRALGHAGMAAALVVTAVQLHLFLLREFRHAHV